MSGSGYVEGAWGPAEWLRFAAAPTFAAMALATALTTGAATDPMCTMAHGSALGGMTPMYLLMSLFHAPPWLKLIFGR